MKKIIQNGKTLLNALAFANVGNIGEFETLINTMDKQPTPHKDVSSAQIFQAAQSRPAVMPPLQQLRSAA